MNRQLLAFIETVLSDENGISEEAYGLLMDYEDSIANLPGCLKSLRQRVDATDGRFYIPSE